MAGHATVYVNEAQQVAPSLAAELRLLTYTPVSQTFNIIFKILVGIKIPRLLKYELIHEGVAVKALERRAQALETAARIGKSIFNLRVDVLNIAGKVSVAAEVTQIAPDERNSIVALGLLPNLHTLAIIIKKYGFVGRIRGQEGLYTGVRIVLEPIFTLVVEEPGHLKPDSILVCGGQGLIHTLADACQVFRLPALGNHLIKDVDTVNMVSAI